MILNRVKVKNYKSFKELDVPLNLPIACLIGLNGAGKTNLLEVIRIAMSDDLNLETFLAGRNVTNLQENTLITLSFLCTKHEYEFLANRLEAPIKHKAVAEYYEVSLYVSYFVKNKQLMRYVLDEAMNRIELADNRRFSLVVKAFINIKNILKTKIYMNNNGYEGYVVPTINDKFIFDKKYISELEIYLSNLDYDNVALLAKRWPRLNLLFAHLIPSNLRQGKYFEDNRVLSDYFNALYSNTESLFLPTELSLYGFTEVIFFSVNSGPKVANKMELEYFQSYEMIKNKYPIFISLLNMTNNQTLGSDWTWSLENLQQLIQQLNNDLCRFPLVNNEVINFSIENSLIICNVVKNTTDALTGQTHKVNVDNISAGTRELLIYELLLENYYANKIILLDEPDHYLHISSQERLINAINHSVKNNNKIIFTTHSPFMLNDNMLCNTFLVENEAGVSHLRNVEQIYREHQNDYLSNSRHGNGLLPFMKKLGFYNIEDKFLPHRDYLIVEGKTDLIALQIMDLILNTNLVNRFVIKYVDGVKNIKLLLQGQEMHFSRITLLVDNDEVAHEFCDPYQKQLANVVYIYNRKYRNLDSLFKISEQFQQLWDKNYFKLKMKLPLYANFLDIILLAKRNGDLDSIVPVKLKEALQKLHDRIINAEVKEAEVLNID